MERNREIQTLSNTLLDSAEWGQLLPEEVLVNIFQMLVVQDGAVRVCRLWNAAAATLTLVFLPSCWIDSNSTLRLSLSECNQTDIKSKVNKPKSLF
uniref:F-box and leucine rich repeat protein 6 n=1 Tax=Xiphophorus maculatus TaxID=8083 RepID=A0A3B5R0F6_XIPMA